MKEQDDVANRMQLDQVETLAPKLLRPNEVAPTGRKRTRTPRHVEPVVPGHLESTREELVGRLLKSTVGARDDQRAWTIRQPMAGRACHDTSPRLRIRRTPNLPTPPKRNSRNYFFHGGSCGTTLVKLTV